jgi:hypothetical protein
MPSTENIAAWLPGVGRDLEIAPADVPEPSKGELLIEASNVLPMIVAISKLRVCKPFRLLTVIYLLRLSLSLFNQQSIRYRQGSSLSR